MSGSIAPVCVCANVSDSGEVEAWKIDGAGGVVNEECFDCHRRFLDAVDQAHQL